MGFHDDQDESLSETKESVHDIRIIEREQNKPMDQSWTGCRRQIIGEIVKNYTT